MMESPAHKAINPLMMVPSSPRLNMELLQTSFRQQPLLLEQTAEVVQQNAMWDDTFPHNVHSPYFGSSVNDMPRNMALSFLLPGQAPQQQSVTAAAAAIPNNTNMQGSNTTAAKTVAAAAAAAAAATAVESKSSAMKKSASQNSMSSVDNGRLAGKRGSTSSSNGSSSPHSHAHSEFESESSSVQSMGLEDEFEQRTTIKAARRSAGKSKSKELLSKLKADEVTEESLQDLDLGADVIKELLMESGLKRQRLARKAELARVSRKNKKSRMCDLEDEVEKLQEELAAMKQAQQATISPMQLTMLMNTLRSVAQAVVPALETLQRVVDSQPKPLHVASSSSSPAL
jgi:hypothetical protein